MTLNRILLRGLTCRSLIARNVPLRLDSKNAGALVVARSFLLVDWLQLSREHFDRSVFSKQLPSFDGSKTSAALWKFHWKRRRIKSVSSEDVASDDTAASYASRLESLATGG